MHITDSSCAFPSPSLSCFPLSLPPIPLLPSLAPSQSVSHFKDIAYSPSVTYGELFLENEREMSAFNLEHADTERVRRRFDLYDEEARALLELKLPIPA